MKACDKLTYQKAHGIGRVRKTLNKILNLVARVMIVPSLRLSLYRLMGISIGTNVFIGMDSYLEDEVPSLVTIEDDVIIAFRVTIVAHDDTVSQVAPIRIRRGSYVGTGAIILMGVDIGEGAIVGAGAVVTKSVEAGAKVMGVPARARGRASRQGPRNRDSVGDA